MTTAGGAAEHINISELLENSTIGPLQIRVFTLSMLCLIMDGFDVQAMGYAAPAVVRDWGIGAPALGPVFAAANFGVLIGSLVFSMVADKIGRRPVMVVSTFFFSVLTLATAFAQDLTQLLWLRFISGIGLGCIIPQATALVAEYSPKKVRVTLMMCITVGFTVGAAIGGFVAAALIPAFGWRSVFIFGGAVPLVIAVGMAWGLPESLQFLAVRKTNPGALLKWLKQLDPALPVGARTSFVANEESKSGVPIVHLFRDGRAATTLLLWVVNFMNIMMLYSLSNWLPTVVTGMGYDTQTAVLVGTVLQVGGTVGAFGLAWMIARGGFIPVLTFTFALAAVSIALIGQPGLSLAMLVVVVFIAGWCVVGGQPGLNALSGSYYPTYLRSTGIGAGLGVGRAGGIVGPIVGGLLLAQQWSSQQLFWAAALPAIVSTLTVVVIGTQIGSRLGRRQAPVKAEEVTLAH
jgi:AAHS family 4-hydroxybenzoate transporter-like MFS transporter